MRKGTICDETSVSRTVLRSAYNSVFIHPDSWEDEAANRSSLRSRVNKRTKQYKKDKIKDTKQNTVLRKIKDLLLTV